MSLDAAQAIGTGEPLSALNVARETNDSGNFATWLQREVTDVNSQLVQADADVRQLAAGQTENLHQVMMSLEKARISLELVVQVRNRLLETYQDIMRMSI